MKQQVIWFAVIALVAQTAQAGHFGFGRSGPGLGDHHGGFGGGFGGDFWGGGFLGGFGGFDAERQQTRFETKFENLQSDYDTGLADITDFYSSDEYTSVVDGMQSLVDRYDLFLSGVERSITRLGDIISIANDDLSYYDDLIAKFQARDDLSQERLDRILERLMNSQDRLSQRIDLLTEKQTTLSDNLGTYQTFSTDLSTYLSDIVTAGGGTTDTTTTTAEAMLSAITTSTDPLRAVAETSAMVDETTMCDQQSALAATAAPEPGTTCLALAALGLLALWRPTRGRPCE